MSRSPTRATWTVACAFLLLIASTLLGQQLQQQKAVDSGEITRMVCKMIEDNHFRQEKLDDQVSEKLLATWLGDLDSQKLYFLQSDVDGFNNQKSKLDDALKEGKLDFAYESFNLYLKRLDERIAYAQKLIDSPFDFKVQETMDTDPKTMGWAKSSEELDERWRKRIKFDILSMKLDDQPDDQIQTRLHKRYRMIGNSIKSTEKDEVMEMYLTALCSVFDPHSSYMSPRTRKEFDMHMKLKLTGIGAVLRSEDGQTIVAEVVPGGAAAKDGRLKMGDKIIAVSDGTGEFIDIVEMKLTKVVEKIRGKVNTPVKLRVLTKEGNETKEYDLIRQVVEIKSQEVKGEIIDAAARTKGAPARIGVISIPSFYRDFQGAEDGVEDFKSTVRDVKTVLKEFKDKGGVDLVVVDLRDNPGGALAEAIEVSGLFIDRGPVVQVKDPRKGVRQLNDDEGGVYCKEPVVVLINRHSASASEIFAGVIKDYGRGIIVGDTTTHGKGTVQSVMDVGSSRISVLGQGPDRGSLKITIQQFYRPNGESTQHQGVPADIKLPSLLDVADQGESGLENALPFEKIDPSRFNKYPMVSSEILTNLQDASAKRVAADPDFQKSAADIAKYLERKDRKQISLNYEELKKEQSAKSDKKADPEDPPVRKSDGPIFLSDAYNNEILSIATDYLKLLRESKTALK